jgi:hypothetical protein
MDFAQWYMDADKGWMAHISESGAIKMHIRLLSVAVGALFTVNLAVVALLVNG